MSPSSSYQPPGYKTRDAKTECVKRGKITVNFALPFDKRYEARGGRGREGDAAKSLVLSGSLIATAPYLLHSQPVTVSLTFFFF